MTKRKISYEQDLALARGRDVARSNQRARLAQRARQDAAVLEREAQEAKEAAKCASGFHGWKNWRYSADYKTETRVCRVCGAAEARPVRL